MIFLACVLTSGRSEPCKDGGGGLKKMYVLDYEDPAFTIAAGEVTAINVAVTEIFGNDLRHKDNKFNVNLLSTKNYGHKDNHQHAHSSQQRPV